MRGGVVVFDSEAQSASSVSSVMDNVRHQVHSAFKGIAEAVLPVRSAAGGFRSSGVLSPDEFVLAGDFLVAACPTWGWEVRVRAG